MFIEDILIPMLIIGAIGALLGLILAIAERVFEVQVDPRIEGVYERLPHYNLWSLWLSRLSGIC